MEMRTPGSRATGARESISSATMVIGVEHSEQRRRLGHPVSLKQVDFGELGAQAFECCERYRRRAISERTQAAKTNGVVSGMHHHQRDHDRHHHGHRDAVALDGVEHRARVECGHEGREAAARGHAEHASHRRGVEHRRLVEEHPRFIQRIHEAQVVEVEHLGPVLEEHALRQTGGPARVHEHDRIVLLGLGGELGHRGPHEFLVGDVVVHVARADEDNLFDPRFLAYPVHHLREERIGETHLRAGVGEYVRELPRRESQVERVDHTTAQERCVPQLQVGKAVQRKHRIAIVRRDAELRPHRMRQRRDPLEVLTVSARHVAVHEADLVRTSLDDREKRLPVHEFLHRDPLPSSGATDALSPSCWSPCLWLSP